MRLQLRRPTTDETLTDAQAYQILTDAQQALFEDIMVRMPNANKQVPVALTSSDGGFTFGFGLDSNGDNIVPMGRVGIYPSLTSIPDYPWQEGVDFLNEGTQLRIPNNRTYAGTLYYYGTIPPAPISANSAPTLRPAADRVLIVYGAAGLYAGWGDLRDPTSYQALYSIGLGRLLLRLKTQFRLGQSDYGAVGGMTLGMLGGL